ncbi:MAG TPA: hypothetical protein VF941_20345 [Clostridia bacterium]
MSRAKTEKMKNILLIALVLASLIQVGVLWEYENHWLPTDFLLKAFHNSSNDKESNEHLADYFTPKRIIYSYRSFMGISNSIDASYHVLPQDNKNYGILWEESKAYLKYILKANNPERKQITLDEWNTVFERKSYIVEFKIPLDTKLIAQSMDIGTVGDSAPKDIKKMLIRPDEDLNEPIITVFILTSDSAYKYSVNIYDANKTVNLSFLGKNSYKGIFDDIEKDGSLKDYMLFISPGGENNEKFKDYFNHDIIIPLTGYSVSQIKKIRIAPPELFTHTQMKTEKFAQMLLGDELHSYDVYPDNNYTEFRNLDNIYKTYEDGRVEYTYLSTIDKGNKGSIGKAFSNAVRFVEFMKKQFMKNTDGVTFELSSIKESADGKAYQFGFDYVINGYTCIVDYGTDSLMNHKDSITIEANEERMTSFKGYILNMEPSDVYSYKESYMDVLVSQALKGKMIENIGICYHVMPSVKEKEYLPSWLIQRKGENNSFLDLEKKK